MASQHEDSSESDGETEPTKCFHRRLSTNKDIRYNSFIKEGFLNKQNGSFQRWHKRYFKLKSGVLYYSKDKKSTIFNQIDLIDSSIAERSLKNINHSFQVITPFRNLVLCAATRSEMKGWVSALRAAASKNVREVTSEMAELSSLSDHHNWCVLPNIRPIFCNVCHESLHRVTRSGVTINGLACEVCKFRTHKKCASKSPSTCKWTTLASMGGNIIEDENGDLMMPHQWMMGNFPVSSKCSVCEKPCSSVLKLQDYWCLWCHCTVHTACKDQTVRCSLGPARVSILPPISITNFDEGGFWRASKSPNTSPLLVFLNSKSGDSQGVKMLRRFKQLLNPAQVFDLMNGGPKIGLRLFQNFESFRVLVCGGDGSVGWVLNEIDRLGLHKQCQVGVLPLGTGNDLSRVLGWGASFDDDTQLPALLEKLEHAQIQMFDRWSIYSYETDQTRNRSLTIDPICAYEDTASNHLSRILHSDSHNVVISSAMVLCSIVQDLVSKVGQSFEETEGCSADKDSFAYKCLTLNQKMEALLKTLAEESTIGQSDHEGTVRSKEQLMCRANSLKKAIRQIVELTEKAVDEQNHQTNQFDKDNERTMSEIISTTTLVASLLSSPDRTLADTLSVRRPSDDRGPFVIVTGEEGLHGSCNGDLASAPSVTDNYETHSTKFAASPVENLTPAKNPSREPTPIIFNYQLCDNLPYVNTSSSPTVATHTLAKSPPGKSTDSLLSPSHPYAPSPSVCSALMPSSPGSSRVFDFCRSSVSPTRVYAASGPVPSCDIPSVNVIDDSILDNEVSQVMHDVNGVEKNHLVVPGSHHYHHHHHLNSHHHHHQYCLSPQQHHHHDHHHHHQTNRHHHHHQFKDPNTLIAQHHLHVYSSSDGEASRSSTPRSPQNCPLNLVDRWSPLFGMPADRMNSPSPYFFEHQTDGKLSHDVSPSKACSNHSGSGRHLSSLSTLYRAPDNPSVAQSGLRHSQKSPEGIQFPLLNVPLLQSLPKQVIGKGRKSSPIHSSLISRALMANADALCAPASPLNDLANINLDDFTEKCVMNNYFGIGLDAKIALDFHNKREEHPKKCRSRTKNMMWYGVLGGKEILQRTHKNLDQKVRLECDGKLIPLPNLQGIVILNIPSYMGGTNFWGGSKEDEYFIAPSFDDKVLEVVAVFGSIQLGISRVINIQRHRIAQCHTVRITIIGDEGLPVQVDGEAWIQNPGVVWIQHKNRAQVLIRDRAFEEALKIWTEKQKLERTTPREPPLSESELATLTTFTEASRDLFEKVTRELELSPPAQALNFVDGFFAAKTSTISTDGKVPPRISRGEVMEFASHMRSFCYDVRRSVLQSQSNKEELDDDRLRNVLEFLEDNSDKVHNMGAQFYERQRNKDRLKLLFKLPKSSRKHRDSAMESLKPEVLTIRDWTHVDVAQWLNALDLGEYAEVFVAHDIRGSELLTLGRTDLKELGIVKVGHLKRLLQEIKFIKEHLKSVEGRRVRNISEDSTTASSHLAPAQAPASPPLVSPPHQPAVEGGDVIATSSSQETSHAFGVEQANSSSSSSSA